MLKSCFGLYNGSNSCEQCKMSRRCSSVLQTHGVDVLTAVMSMLVDKLPEKKYRDTDSMDELTGILLEGVSSVPSNVTGVASPSGWSAQFVTDDLDVVGL